MTRDGPMTSRRKTRLEWLAELDAFNDQRVFPLSMRDYRARLRGAK